MPLIAQKFGRKKTHSIALLVGGISLLSFYLFSDPTYLIIPMIGIGFAWGSILAMPYAIVANSIPQKSMGMFMGIFNMSITIPQIVSGVFAGLIVRYFFNDNTIYAIYLAGAFMILGAVSVMFINENKK